MTDRVRATMQMAPVFCSGVSMTAVPLNRRPSSRLPSSDFRSRF